MGARYYDAQVGRFITRDTYLDEHPYLYCEHEPVNFVDPSGHIPLLLAFAIGAGIGLLLQGAKDVVDDGKVNDPWWNYVGAGGLGGVGGVGVGAAKGGVTWTWKHWTYKFAFHRKPHPFPGLGPRPHFQLNWWKPGVKRSGVGKVKRWPIPWW